MKTFGERLRFAREMRGLQQKEFAKLLEVDPSFVSLFENGKRKPSLDNLVRLADTLNVSIDWLVGRRVRR